VSIKKVAKNIVKGKEPKVIISARRRSRTHWGTSDFFVPGLIGAGVPVAGVWAEIGPQRRIKSNRVAIKGLAGIMDPALRI
jgi:hypothetical protein